MTISGEIQEEHGNIPHGLSPPRQYVPAGAEEDETSSSTSTYEQEETVEEGLANYFSNPSYRAANPDLLEPIESEEDWGDVPPVLLPIQLHRKFLNQQQGLKRGRGICKEEEKEDKIGGEEIMIKTT